MVSAVSVCLNHIHQKTRQIIGIGGGPYLIIYNADCSPLCTQAQHGFYKVLSGNAKYPGNADSEKLFYQFLHCQLSLVLCLSVYIQRMPFVIRLPGAGSGSVKHIIRADVHHFDSSVPAGKSYIARSLAIDFPAQLHIVFCSIYCSICSTVNHCVSS